MEDPPPAALELSDNASRILRLFPAATSRVIIIANERFSRNCLPTVPLPFLSPPFFPSSRLKWWRFYFDAESHPRGNNSRRGETRLIYSGKFSKRESRESQSWREAGLGRIDGFRSSCSLRQRDGTLIMSPRDTVGGVRRERERGVDSLRAIINRNWNFSFLLVILFSFSFLLLFSCSL